MRKATTFAALFVTAGTACSFLVDTGGLSGVEQVAAAEGGADVTSVDAGMADGPPADVIVEASGTWCARNRPDATFCADFDDGRALAQLGVVTGPVSIVPGEGFEQSAALALNLPATTTSGSAYLLTSFFGSATFNEVEVAVRVPVPGDGTYFETLVLELTTTKGRYLLYAAVNKSIVIAEDMADATRVLTTVPLDMSVLRKVTFSVDVSTSPWRIRATVDGVAVADEPSQLAPDELPSTQVKLNYGAPYSAPSSAKQIFLDNVALQRR